MLVGVVGFLVYGGGFALLVYPMTYLPQYSQMVKTGGLSDHVYVAIVHLSLCNCLSKNIYDEI